MPQPTDDLAGRLTQWFLEAKQKGVGTWTQPWRTTNAEGRLNLPRRHDGSFYRGVNIPILWMQAQERGYVHDIWMTYAQSQELGGQVRKGERSSQSVFFKPIPRKEVDDNGDEVDKSFRLMKIYSVFNVAQIDGLPEGYYRIPEPVKGTKVERLEWAETYLDNCGVDVRWGGTKAYFNRSQNFIQMPLRELFDDAVQCVTTRVHETAHWAEIAAGIVLNRKRFGDHDYAAGEMLAESSATLWASKYGIEQTPRLEHAAYISGWENKVSDFMKENNRAIFWAWAGAQKIVDHLDSLQPKSQQPAQPAP